MAINGINSIVPLFLSHSASANAELARFDDAWRCIDEAMTAIETTKERWCEAEVNRVAGTIALRSPEPDAAKAEACFERALAVARQQQAKSWELRAAMSMARLWRDQGKRDEARDLLAPIYEWFTEGFKMRLATSSLQSTAGSGGLRHARSERGQSATHELHA
jgi:predicted ATPase